MSRSAAAFVLVFVCISRMSADPQNAIKGQVTDSEGAVIAKARVLIHLDPSAGGSSATEDLIVFTDSSGMYSVIGQPATFSKHPRIQQTRNPLTAECASHCAK